jgi:uncharacterized membrane protein YgdD (TMEM256/DUF423 family)
LIACSLVTSGSLPFKIAAGSFVAGQVLFIAPLYASAIRGKDPYLRKIMPVGGGSMMVGWGALIFA